ncbi:MAG: hypothetical protein ABGW87_12360 [Sphingomonadaceae bacterium]
MPTRKPVDVTDLEALERLDRWLAASGGSASFEDVVREDDQVLVAGYLLRGFRRAARDPVFDRFRTYSEDGANRDAGSGLLFHLVDHVAAAWAVTSEEKLTLLALKAPRELEVLRDVPFSAVPPETLERGVLLLDMFLQLNAILPKIEHADSWIRRPNSAPLFGGDTALSTMLEGGLGMMRATRGYLRSEALGAW